MSHSKYEFCYKEIDNRGMASHLHFKHLRSILVKFRLNWMVCYAVDDWLPRFEQLQLTEGK